MGPNDEPPAESLPPTEQELRTAYLTLWKCGRYGILANDAFLADALFALNQAANEGSRDGRDHHAARRGQAG